MVGKYIRTEWNHNDGYVQTWLRRISRETKTQYISEVQRYFRNFEDGVNDRVFKYRWAKRYNKNSDGSISVRNTHLSNPDGIHKLQVIDLLSETDLVKLRCVYSFSDLFETDIRLLQSENCYPRKLIEKRYLKCLSEGKTFDKDRFFVDVYSENSTNHWNEPLIKWLEDTFKVPVYAVCDINEHFEQGILTKSATYLHITHFGDDKKILKTGENYHNRTICFWLFEDKLVFKYEDGKDSH